MHIRTLIPAALIAVAPVAASAQNREGPPTINVDATASVERSPDRAVLTLAVETEGSTAQEASQGNADSMARLLAALKQAGLQGPAVRTLTIRLSPVYSPQGPDRDEPPHISGYRAVNMVQVTVDSVARAGRIVDTAINAGANRLANLSFELKDPDEARIAALQQAVSQAKREAEAVAAAAGRTLGDPLEITINSDMGRPMPMYAERGVAMAQSADTPVEGGTLTITATIHVVYRLDPR
jgi:uncharacterized protein